MPGLKCRPVSRRQALLWLAGSLAPQAVSARETRNEPRATVHAQVVPGYRMEFPRDHGSHPDFRLEWWYVTGWLASRGDSHLGFQITLFRARPDLKEENPSAFAPREIIIAHAAISDPARGSLVHAQRAARSGFELAG